MKEIYTFKNWVEDIIDKKNMKLWLSKRKGKRVEYIFKVGTEQFLPPEKLLETDEYLLFGQNINNELKERIIDEVKNYVYE